MLEDPGSGSHLPTRATEQLEMFPRGEPLWEAEDRVLLSPMQDRLCPGAAPLDWQALSSPEAWAVGALSLDSEGWGSHPCSVTLSLWLWAGQFPPHESVKFLGPHWGKRHRAELM